MKIPIIHVLLKPLQNTALSIPMGHTSDPYQSGPISGWTGQNSSQNTSGISIYYKNTLYINKLKLHSTNSIRKRQYGRYIARDA